MFYLTRTTLISTVLLAKGLTQQEKPIILIAAMYIM